VKYRSLVGELTVRRYTYREIGVRNGPTIVALDLSVGLLQGLTRRLARSVATGYAAGPLRKYMELMDLAGRPLPPRATLERKATKLASELERDTPILEAFVRTAEPDLERNEVHSICIGLDRTSTPMDEDPSREDLAKRPKRPKRPTIRRSKGPRAVRYRMAYAAVIHLLDADKQPLRTLRFAATAEDGPHDMLERMAHELVFWRERAPDATVLAIQDGAPELWNLLTPILNEIAPGWEGLLDWYHVNEHLADAARAIHRAPPEQRHQLRRWQSLLLSRARGATTIAAEIDRHAFRRRGVARRRLGNHANYLYFGEKKLNFAKFRRRGWPIGSGALEGACKSTIKQRANRSGQRWSNPGLRGVLAIRSLDDSQRLLLAIDHAISLRSASLNDSRH
jgi:hypothetical protein